MLKEHVIESYGIPEGLEDHKIALTLGYEDGEVSTTAFDNHSDVRIQRPGFPEVDIPIMGAERFYIQGYHIYAKHNEAGFDDRISLGRVRKVDLEKAMEWVDVANSRI